MLLLLPAVMERLMPAYTSGQLPQVHLIMLVRATVEPR